MSARLPRPARAGQARSAVRFAQRKPHAAPTMQSVNLRSIMTGAWLSLWLLGCSAADHDDTRTNPNAGANTPAPGMRGEAGAISDVARPDASHANGAGSDVMQHADA